MAENKRTGLYWFTRDLRLDDMPSLVKLNSVVDKLILVYFKQPSWFTANQFGLKTMGAHRWAFTAQGLADLNQQVGDWGQHIHLIDAEPEEALPAWCEDHNITDIGVSQVPGVYESRQRAQLQQLLTHITWHTGTSDTLFTRQSLPHQLEEMKNTFTPWRKKIEVAVSPEQPIAAPRALKPPPMDLPIVAHEAIDRNNLQGWHGGERYGLAQLDYYFEQTDFVARYKETRNGMGGWDFSSKFSAWLASGMLSVRRVAQRLADYEQHVTQNESTYWLYFELLWREFFRWQLKKHQALFFAAGGFKQHQPNMAYDATAFKRWCQGDTGCDIVDAAMREMNHTGFMSNRARQLCASYLVHELAQHWRYGAAYFEQMLVDFDVASNWGNWLYLAGGGSDPRGQRKFDMQQQTERYDPERKFIHTWLS